jgi:RNA polymerase sigma factor (sigma-70 family)
MAADSELLKQYLAGSHEAFGELVGRHAGWVYCAARRRVGDEHLAEDVTQAVFILLAQKAGKVRGSAIGPWLMEVTRRVSQHALRSRQRRQRHEQAAPAREVVVEEPIENAQRREISDRLDESMRKLRSADQRAILLRFFQQKSLEEVGREMGLSEDSARKRVKRALDRLRNAIEVAGLAVTPGVLGEWMERQSVQSVPAHVLASSGAAALAGASGAGQAFNFARGVNRMWMWSNVRVAAAIAIIILVPAIFCVNVLQKWARGQDEGSANPTARAPDPFFYTMATDIMMEMSSDGTKMWGFSILKGGPWAEASAPAGTTFDKSSVTLATGIGAAQAGNREFVFIPGTGTWDSVELPDSAKTSVWVATRMTCFQAGDRVYAAGGLVGGWDSFQVPPGTKTEISCGTDWATCKYGTHLWAFSAAEAKWHGIDIAAGAGGHL